MTFRNRLFNAYYWVLSIFTASAPPSWRWRRAARQ